MGRDAARTEKIPELGFVAVELRGSDVAEIEAGYLHTLDEYQVERNAGNDPRGVADGDEAATAPQGPQRRFGQFATDGVDDGISAIGQGLTKRGPHVTVSII